MFRLFLIIILMLLPMTVQAAHQVNFISEISVESPLYVASDSDRNIYVTSKEATVTVYSPDGKKLRKMQEKDSSGNSALKKPRGIAVYGDRIYVCDKSKDKIAIFSKNGEYRESFGEGGSGPKQFSNPEGIFVYQGVIYVADYGNNRIQVFSDTGVHLQTIGRTGQDEHLLKNPTDVAVDSRGNVYAIDGGSRKIKIYRQNGNYEGQITGVVKPLSLAITEDGILVTDSENYNITKFSFKGEKLFSFGTFGAGKVQFKDILGISADGSGRVYAVDGDKKTVQIIETDKPVASDLPFNVAPPTSVKWTRDIRQYAKKMAWDRTRNVLYAIDSDKEILHVIKNGETIKKLKLADRNPVAVAVDPHGMPWIFDAEENQLLKLDHEGKILIKVGSSGEREGYFSKPSDIFISRDGLIYVADTNNNRIQVFNTDGVFMNVFTKGVGLQLLKKPVALDQDAQGNLYVLLSSRNVVVVLAPNGDPVREFGKSPSGSDEFEEPVSLSVVGNELMVLDRGSNNIKVFGLLGDVRRAFGAKGSGKGDFKKPAAITVMNGSSFFVSDTGNSRIQEFSTVYTPDPPQEVNAKGGMRIIDVSWKASENAFIDSFRLFRSQKESHEYKEVAIVTSNTYQDKDVLPEVSYSYRVSARIKGGNENISIESAEATPLKFTPQPPVSFEGRSQEWSVDLSWKPQMQAYIDHYAVYLDSEEEDVPPTLLSKTKETSYSEGGLDSDTLYTYLVSTVSIDGVESERVALDISTTIATKPPLEIDIIGMSDIFSNTYKIYENEGIGKVRLTNNTKNEIVALKLAFSIKEYMDFATEIEIKSLAPQQCTEINLKAVFNNKILEITEDTPVQTELRASYFENQKQRTFSKNNTINLYEKHRMMWTNKNMVATFVTSKDPVVLEFTRSIVTQYSDIGSPLVFAAAIYDYLGLTGMTYLQHPNNPYQIVEGKTSFVDYVQYPRETLKRNSGVCTDLVVLFAAALEGLGIKTKLLGTPDHLFIMFAVGQVSDLGDSTMNGMLAIHEDTVWAPVELTLVGSTFMKAWEAGSKEYYEWKEKGIEITDLGNAWGRYKPATLPVTEWRTQSAKRSEIDARYGNEIVKLNKIKLKYTSNRYFEQIKRSPSDGNAYHQLGIIYGEAGELEESRKFLKKAQTILPGNADIMHNLANLLFLKKDYTSALQAYQKVAELDPSDPNILVNIALCYLKLDNKEMATEAFQRANKKDPSLVKKHRTIAIELLGSM